MTDRDRHPEIELLIRPVSPITNDVISLVMRDRPVDTPDRVLVAMGELQVDLVRMAMHVDSDGVKGLVAFHGAVWATLDYHMRQGGIAPGLWRPN